MDHTKIEYEREKAFEEFDRCYKYAYSDLSQPKKWLTKRELEVLGQFDAIVRIELEKQRDSKGDELTIHFSVKPKSIVEGNAIRVMIYWLMEQTLSECPLLRRWYCHENKERSLGEGFSETRSGLIVEWKVDLKKFYSKEVWA